MGKADNPKQRLNSHRSHTGRSYRTNWISKLKSCGRYPLLEIIDEVPIEYWQQWEVAWIQYFREQGCNLVNCTLGGDGNHGVKHSSEWNRKISEAQKGKEIPGEQRKQIAFTLTGKKTCRNTSGVVGVSKVGKFWQAAITENRRTRAVGYFLNFEDAVRARETAVKERIQNVGSF